NAAKASLLVPRTIRADPPVPLLQPADIQQARYRQLDMPDPVLVYNWLVAFQSAGMANGGKNVYDAKMLRFEKEVTDRMAREYPDTDLKEIEKWVSDNVKVWFSRIRGV